MRLGYILVEYFKKNFIGIEKVVKMFDNFFNSL